MMSWLEDGTEQHRAGVGVSGRRLKLLAAAVLHWDDPDHIDAFVCFHRSLYSDSADRVMVRVKQAGCNGDSDSVLSRHTAPQVCDFIREVFGEPFSHRHFYRADGHFKQNVPAQNRWKRISHVRDGWLTPDVVNLANAIYEQNLWTDTGHLADAMVDAGFPERVTCPTCFGRTTTGAVCKGCFDTQTSPNPLLYHLRTRQCWDCQGRGNHLGAGPDRGNPECETCWGTGTLGDKHVRGCWVVDLLTGRE